MVWRYIRILRQHIRISIVLATVVVLGAATPFVHRAMTRAPPAPTTSTAVPVVAGTVQKHEVPIYLSGIGTVIAYNTVVVRSQITGQIVGINFTEGQTVHTADLLAEIDARPYQAQLDQMI